MPFVSFVGAGPGDPELITLKGLRRLREAEVVLHDRLVPPELLDEVSPGATVVDVGKAPGRPCSARRQINWLLVDWARRRERVVRLKGGDPAVFGRLGDEIDAVRGGARLRGDPRRHRGDRGRRAAGRVADRARGAPRCVVFAAGTDQTGTIRPALDWDLLARVEGTLVFYMPVGALEPITAALHDAGARPSRAGAARRARGHAGERVIAGRLGDIADEGRAAGVAAPALLITGPTVAAASVPLTVRRILSTADRAERARLLPGVPGSARPALPRRRWRARSASARSARCSNVAPRSSW